MSRSGLDVFDTTVQETHRWLKIVMEVLETDNRRMAFAVLRAVLHALRDRIGPANAVHLGAQLPMLLRGAYYEGWHVAGTPTRERHLGPFLEHIGRNLEKWPIEPAEAARAAFVALAERLDAGEVAKVIGMLPLEIRALWPDYASAPAQVS
jgi:uncharacterized protein (DUF2267 family)